ncbi:MAG: type II secretion system major pseudopilin GspG [Verrucomicrobiota bacterium]
MKLKSKRNRGFTLIEIMLVIGIVVVLMGSAIFMMGGTTEFAKEHRVRSDLQQIATQLKLYEIQNYSPPSTEQGVSALVTKPRTEPVPRRWSKLMDDVPLDPWGNVYQYRYPGKHNTDSFDLYSLGKDRVESEDDIGNWDG